MTAVFSAAMPEWRRSSAKGLVYSEPGGPVFKDRLERVMQSDGLAREIERLEHDIYDVLGVGGLIDALYRLVRDGLGCDEQLLGHWRDKTNSLAVVAPGIAEALFATAPGLVAAIPAVVAYNKLSNDLGRYAGRMETFAGEFIAILSRQIEEKG